MNQEAVENLSARQKVARWIEKLSRIYREEIQKPQWIEIAITSIEKRRKRGLIETNLSRISREAVELEKNEFFKEEKHKEMNATSKLLKHRTNQHIKLSKHLSTYMQSIQDPKHTHTQILTNFIFQK